MQPKSKKSKMSTKEVVSANVWKEEFNDVLGKALIKLEDSLGGSELGGQAIRDEEEFAQAVDQLEAQLLKEEVGEMIERLRADWPDAAELFDSDLEKALNETAVTEQLNRLRALKAEAAQMLPRPKTAPKGVEELDKDIQQLVQKLGESANPDAQKAATKFEARLRNCGDETDGDQKRQQLQDLRREVLEYKLVLDVETGEDPPQGGREIPEEPIPPVTEEVKALRLEIQTIVQFLWASGDLAAKKASRLFSATLQNNWDEKDRKRQLEKLLRLRDKAEGVKLDIELLPRNVQVPVAQQGAHGGSKSPEQIAFERLRQAQIVLIEDAGRDPNHGAEVLEALREIDERVQILNADFVEAHIDLTTLARTLEVRRDPEAADRLAATYRARRKAIDQQLVDAKTKGIEALVKPGLERVDQAAGADDYVKALAELEKVIHTVALRRDQIRKDFEEAYNKIDPLDVRMFLVKAPTQVRKDLKTFLNKWNVTAAAEEVEKFQNDIRRAVRRKPLDLGAGELQEFQQKHQKAGLQNARYARNVEQARSAAMRLVDDYGQLDPEATLFADFPFVNNSDDIRKLQSEIAESPEKGLPQSTHALNMLKKLKDQPELRKVVQAIQVPQKDPQKDPNDEKYNAYQKSPSAGLIRTVLGLSAEYPVGDAEARRAAVASLLTKLRQHDVGSCFATALAVETQSKAPEVFLNDIKSLIETGTITRTTSDPAKAVTIPRVDPKLHEWPAFQKALDSLGIPANEQEAALEAALTQLRQGLDGALTEDHFTPVAVLKEVQKALPNSLKNASELDTALKEAAAVYLEAGKVVMPLNPDASRADLTQKVTIPKNGGTFHEKPAVIAALDAMGVPENTMKKTVDEALDALRQGAAATLTEDTFTPEQILKKIAELRSAGGKTAEESQKELEAATLAFQAQQENPLLRAYEFTVASLAELGETEGKKIRGPVQKAAEDGVLAIANALLSEGQDQTVVDQFYYDFCDKFDALFAEQVAIRFDASVVTKDSNDGSSSAGVWMMRRKSDDSKIHDVASQEKLIKDLMAQVAATYKGTANEAWADRVVADNATVTLSAGPPPQPTGAGNLGIQDLLGAFYNNSDPVNLDTVSPQDAKETFAWILKQNHTLRTTSKTQIDNDPDVATTPLRGGPHVFSMKPGAAQFRALTDEMDNGKTAVEMVTAFVDKNTGIKDTLLTLDLQPGSRVSRLVEKTCAGMDPSWGEGILKWLGTLPLSQQDITPAELKAEIEDFFTQSYVPVFEQDRQTQKSKNRENFGKSVVADASPDAPKIPVDVTQGSILRKLVDRALAVCDSQDVQSLTDDVKNRLTGLGSTEITPAQIKEAIDQMLTTEHKQRLLAKEKSKSRRAAGRATVADSSPGAAIIAIDLNQDSDFMKLLQEATGPIGPEFLGVVKKSFETLPTTTGEVTAAEIHDTVKKAVEEAQETLDRTAGASALTESDKAITSAILDGSIPVAGTLVVNEALIVNILGPLAAVPGVKGAVLSALAVHDGNATVEQVNAAIDDLMARDFTQRTPEWREQNKQQCRDRLAQEALSNADLTVPTFTSMNCEEITEKALAHLPPDLAIAYQTEIYMKVLNAEVLENREVALPEIMGLIKDILTDEYPKGLKGKRDQTVAKAGDALVEAVGAREDLQTSQISVDSPELEQFLNDTVTSFPDEKQEQLRQATLKKLQALTSGPQGTVTLAQARQAVGEEIQRELDEKVNATQAKTEAALGTAVSEEDTLLNGTINLASPELDSMLGAALANLAPDILPTKKKELMARIEKLGFDPISLAEVRQELDKLVEEDQKKTDEADIKGVKQGLMNRLAGAVIQEVTPPYDTAELEVALTAALKSMEVPDVPDGEHTRLINTVKSKLSPRPTMTEVEAALKDAFFLDPEYENKVEGSLRPPAGPPGIVFADTNWEDDNTDNEIHFTMVVNPLSDELELWQVNADGSNPRPMDQDAWVKQKSWAAPSNPAQVGSVV